MQTSIGWMLAVAAALTAFNTIAHAEMNPTPVVEARICDPCVPASVRQKAMAAVPLPAQTLQEAVAQRLKARFDAADLNGSGMLTRAQAEAGGFGFIALNFDAIDSGKKGVVTFRDVQLFLATRRTKPE
jgi:hypothetical protein